MSIYTTLHITREDAIELIKKKLETNLSNEVIESTLFSMFEDGNYQNESAYYNYAVVDSYNEENWPYTYERKKDDFEGALKDL